MTVENPASDQEISVRLLPSTVREISEWIRRDLPGARTEMLRESLESVRKIFGAPRALMIWEEADEPWVNTAYLESDDLVWKQNAPATYEPVVSTRLSHTDFFFTLRGESTAHHPIHPLLQSDFGIESALVLLLDGEMTAGRLLVLDIELDPQHFLTGTIVAAIIEARFAQSAFTEIQEPDEVELRIRSIARDLHDGLLQSFTGIVLQLENLLPVLESDPDEARRRVTEVEGVLMNEQRELRSYLESLSEKKRLHEADFEMTSRLQDLAHRYRDQWGVEIEYRSNVLDPMVRKALGWETYRIITETITNATKHGHAKHIEVGLATSDDNLIVTVKDDGEGFRFRGRLNSDEMIADGVAPTSLTERIRSLNGEIWIESSDEGSLVEMSIPIGWRES
ncbi:MAG: hypothetical protein KY432_00680 [Acidobacteria bacterium]|nr:hypothetical protein [Acidobacteriota bacterium]